MIFFFNKVDNCLQNKRILIFLYSPIIYCLLLMFFLIQYYIFGLSGDYLGGFFGTTRGCNGYLNVFVCIIYAVALAEFLESKIKAGKFVLYLVTVLFIAIIAELKVVYIEMVFMSVFAVILSKPTFKTISLSLLCLVGFILGAIALLIYDPKSFGVLFDFDMLEWYLTGTGYTSSGDLNRFTAIGQIFNMFFKGNPIHALFGFGLGNCEYSQFSFLQSDFALKYGAINYRWFTHAWVYLEQGAVGLALLVAFFISLLIYACTKSRSSSKRYMIMAIAFLPTCIIGLIYNTAIQVENCYIIALVCALPYIANKSKYTELKDE